MPKKPTLSDQPPAPPKAKELIRSCLDDALASLGALDGFHRETVEEAEARRASLSEAHQTDVRRLVDALGGQTTVTDGLTGITYRVGLLHGAAALRRIAPPQAITV